MSNIERADPEVLLGDPVFQLNFCLWMTQRFPQVADVTPVFREAGYVLVALGRLLNFPPNLSEQVRAANITPTGPRPDVLLRHHAHADHLLLECKKSSFGTDSTTSNQARKLLMLASDVSSSVGRPGPISGTALYVLPRDQNAQQVATLKSLSEELRGKDLPTGDCGCIGIEWDDQGIWISLQCDSGPDHLRAALKRERLVISRPPGERIIYAIPYDPSVTQDPSEEAYCLKLLSERLHIAALAEVGRYEIPGTLNLYGDSLLNQATLGTFTYWRGDERKTFEKRAVKILAATLRRVASKRGIVRQQSGPDRLEIDLDNEVEREEVIDAIRKANPGVHAAIFSDPQTELEEPKGNAK